jgi:cobalt-zinc-cadmium efflux system membrane fusion protein
MKRRSKSLTLTLLVVWSLLAAGCRRPAPAGEGEKSGSQEKREPHADAAISESVQLSSAAIAEAGIKTWKVEPVDLAHLLSLNGTVEYDEDRLVHVASNVAGRVASIPVDLGARVREGDPLVWIESAELAHAREAFLRALSELKTASRSYERARRLVEAKAISKGEFQTREGDFLGKKAAADAAERALQLSGETSAELARIRSAVEADRGAASFRIPRVAIRAPFAGRVIERKVTPGTLVQGMQPLLTLADLSRVRVFLQVYEKDLSLVRQGLPVRIRAEAYPQDTFSGRIDFLGGVVEEATRAVRVRATVENRPEKLRPGMFVKAHVEVPKTEKETSAVLAVPQIAIQTLEGRTNVFVQVADGKFSRRIVETGHSFEGFTEILSGIRTGEQVVTEGSFVLKSEFARADLSKED